jgi:hypothetical protein
MKFELPYSCLPIEIAQWLYKNGNNAWVQSETKITKTDDGAVNADPVIFVNIADKKVAVMFALTWM